jgi:acyl dehydratase
VSTETTKETTKETPTFSTGPITPGRIAQFSAAMRDPNPVHLDPEFCRALGLPGIIAPGGMAVVALGHLVALRFGLHAVRGLDIAFRSPVHAGESLTCTFTVGDEVDGLRTVQVAACAGDGRVCAEGTVVVRPDQEGSP